MLKRIAVLGEGGAEGIEGEDIQVLSVAPGEPLPCGTNALVAAPGAGVQAAALELARAHEATLQLIADAVAIREGAPLGAEARVLAHATRFAHALGLSGDERSALERGAILRDVGKLCINNDLLLKSSVLSYDDWILIRRHTELGAQLLEARDIDADVLDIVRSHHECWDGDGYPKNLEREAIPLLARIMKIIDVYCAMTSPRHYRPQVTGHDDALAYFSSERGKHYDPELIDVFIDKGVAQPA